MIITKKRRLPGGFYDQMVEPTSYIQKVYSKTDGSLVQTQEEYARLSSNPGAQANSQVTESESHPDWRRRVQKNFDVSGDIGGPFFSQKQCIQPYGLLHRHKLKKVRESLNGMYDIHALYDGYVFPAIPSLTTEEYEWTKRNLAPIGTTAIARCKPTNAVADLAVFLAELYSDGLPKLFGATLWKENVQLARSAGEEYLNTEFGWKPLVGDVQDITFALSHASTVLEQYERGSGRMTRRRYEFPIEKTSTLWDDPSNSEVRTAPFAQHLYDTSIEKGNSKGITSTWRRTWFSGAFTYHLPTGYRSRNAIVKYGTQARTLLGLNLTPEVLWEAAPWSWAIDWFSNAGDVISNLSDWATDGLVLKYGYIMEHSFINKRYYWFGNTRLPGDPTPAILDSFVETKRREAATPFGFGLTWDGLSPRQLAISAALGLTRR